MMSFNNTFNNSKNKGNAPTATADAPEAAAGVEIVAAEEPTLLAPASSADAAESGSGGLWLQNVFGGVELSMSMRNDESVEESNTASTRSLGTASFLSKNKKIIFFALTGLLVVAVAIGASQVANKRTISSAAASAAKTPKFSKEPKTGSKTPKITKAPKTAVPSFMPSDSPSTYPSDLPSSSPSLMPSDSPSVSVAPSEGPSAQPSSLPSSFPSLQPSSLPSSSPSEGPSAYPSTVPSSSPSLQPSGSPSSSPSEGPSTQPSSLPSASPSLQPSSMPSSSPSDEPSAQPSSLPSASPSLKPSSSPSVIPSDVPSESPSKYCGSIEGTFNGSEASLPLHLKARSGSGSCSSAKSFPRTNRCDNCRFLEFGPFTGDGSPDDCLKINFDKGSCKGGLIGISTINLVAYSNAFDPSNLSNGYLGDLHLGGSGTRIRFPYVSDTPVYVVAMPRLTGPSDCSFSFDFEWSECAAARTSIAPMQGLRGGTYFGDNDEDDELV